MSPRGLRGRHPVFAFAAAAVAVILIVGLPVVLLQGMSGDQPPATDAVVAPSTTADVEPTTTVISPTTTIPVPVCGTQLPFSTVLPEDFDGPNPGPSPQAVDALEPGQTIVHWTGRGGSVELRWPANAEYIESAVWGADPIIEGGGSSFVLVQDLTIDGVEYQDVPQGYDRLPTDGMTGPCDAVQLTVFRPNGTATVGSGFGPEDTHSPNTLVVHPDIPRPRDLQLVVGTMEVEVVPEVVECSGGSEAAGFEVPPNKSETIADPQPFPTPLEALEALLSGQEGWPKTGYFELHEPDGSITFGNPQDDMSADPRPENGIVIAVSVIEMDGGWAVDSWSTSGC
jgi:hypothetical protein